MSRDRAPARGSNRTSQHGDAAKQKDGGSRSGRATQLHDSMGNAALARALAARGDAERSADRAAETVAPGGRPAAAAGAPAPPPPAARIALGPGEPLPASDRAVLEPALGTLDDVRVHRDAAAARDARAMNALAFTVGRDVVFGDGQYAPGTPSGRWLLAHEAAHVAQQRNTASQLQRQPFGSGYPGNACYDESVAEPIASFAPPDAVTIDPVIEQTITDQPVTELVTMEGPSTEDPTRRRRRREEDETVAIHSTILGRIPIVAYAVPASWVTRDPPAHLVAPNARPPAAPPRMEGEAATAPSTEFAPGDIAYTPDGRALRVAAARGEHVVTMEYTKYAVGAGSATLLRTDGGFFLIDAGANLNESAALAEGVAQRIVQQLNGAEIRGAFLTHMHYDHVSLLRRLRSLVPIREIAYNPAQRTAAQFPGVRNQVLAGEAEFLQNERARRMADPDAHAAFLLELEARPGSDRTMQPEWVQEQWRQHVEAQVAALPRTAESIMIPASSGILDTVRTRPMDAIAGTPLAESAGIPMGEARMIAFSDPGSAAVTQLEARAVDRFSSSYLIEMPGGARIIVLSDLRARDMRALQTTFFQAMQDMGVHGATFQLWDIGHHIQIGWGGSRPRPDSTSPHAPALRETRATNLRMMLQMLHDSRARTPGGGRGHDGLSVSVDPTKVDVGTHELLQSLGFEIFPAGTPGDVQVFEILTYTGERVTGTTSTGGLPDIPNTLERSHRGRDALEAKADLRQQSAEALPESDPARAPLMQEAVNLRLQRLELDRLERRFVDAVELTAHGRTMQTPRTAEDPGVRAAREAIEAFCAAHDIPPVTTRTMRLTDAALLLIRREPGAEPPPGTPAAERRARARVASEMRRSIEEHHRALLTEGAEHPASAVVDLYAELQAYEAQLDTIIAETPAGSSEMILLAERTRVRDMHRSMIVETTSAPTPSRLPSGELVETNVRQLQAPEDREPATDPTAPGTPRAPGLVARGMLRTLDVAGRGLGALMVYSSVHGERDLINRYEEGRASAGQLVVGTAERVTSGVVGLQMLRGAKVGTGVFVLISALQIGEAALGNYASERERNIELAYATINAAVGLACMMIGEALIATMNPIGILAGAIIMFLGPMLLDALGLHGWLERQMGFLPPEVTGLNQHLRTLLDEYQVISGAIHNVMRDPQSLAELHTLWGGATQSAARDLIRSRRARAADLEPDVLDAFDSAYEAARVAHAGLAELDGWRRNFLDMQNVAWTGFPELNPGAVAPAPAESLPGGVPFGPVDATGSADAGVSTSSDAGVPADYEAGTPLPTPVTTPTPLPNQPFDLPDNWATMTETARRHYISMQRFQEIEETTATAMQALTSSDVIEMSQWSEITSGCASVVRVLPITYTSGNWSEVNNKMRELRMMIDNARYRVEPSRFGDFRTVPLIPPTSPARGEYDRQLRMAENRVQNTMQMVATAISNNGLSYDVNNPFAVLPQDQIRQDDQTTMSLDAAMDVAINTLVSYRLFMHDAPRPPARFLLGNALYRHAAVAGTEYRAYIDDNSDYANSLQRLEAIENATDLAIAGAERIARVDAALEDVRAASADAASGVDAVSGASPLPPVTPPMSHARRQLANVAEFRRQFDVERAGRHWRDGLVFSSEIADLESTRRESTAASYAALLAGPGEHHPMTPDEEVAMGEGAMGSFGADLLANRGVILDRLELIPDLRLPSDCDTLTGIMRLDSTPNVTDVDVKLVGIVSPEVTFRRWHILWHVTHNPRVVALNAAAEAVLGDDRIHEVENSRLSTAYGSDIGLSLPAEQEVQ